MTPSCRDQHRTARGWLPVSIGIEAQSKQTIVRWLEFGPARLAEPFFAHTVEKLRRSNPPARETVTGVETLLEIGETLAPITPSGFIFHVSRCGSTLIANALKTVDTAVVVSEPAPLSVLLHPDADSFAAGTGASWDQLRRTLFSYLVSLYANYRTGEPQQVVIKFQSWNISLWQVVRSYWPEVPCVVVIRDPVEVMTANLAGGGWMDFKESPEMARRLFGWENLPRSVAEMSREEYAARVMRRFYLCAGEMAGERCRIVDYRDIDAAKLRGIAEFFGLEPDGSGRAMEETLEVYSKDPEGARTFQPDSLGKQKAATGLVRSAAYQWASEVYRDLRKRV